MVKKIKDRESDWRYVWLKIIDISFKSKIIFLKTKKIITFFQLLPR